MLECLLVNTENYILAFDTANEQVAVGIGKVVSDKIQVIKSVEEPAHRASNTKLLPLINSTISDLGIRREQIDCICAGRGPGSFTGVRICLATAKGIAAALEAPLVGLSTLDAVA